MSSVPALEALWQDNYVSLAIFTTSIYDYVLVFPNEVEYVWSKPWTKVSTLYLLVRYCGLIELAMDTLLGTSFIPGPAKMCVFTSYLRFCTSEARVQLFNSSALQGEILNTLSICTYPLFIGAADFVMLLRIWAMYNRSRLILVTLLTLFSVEVVSSVATAAAYSDPKNYNFIVIPVFEYSSCALQNGSPIWIEVTCILQMVFATVLCMLATTHFMRELVSSYHATRQPKWHCQLNRYINLLVKQGIIYFIVIFLLSLLTALGDRGEIPVSGWQGTLGYIFQQVPVYTLTPRFIISVREMYAHDIQARRGSNVDTGFGLSSHDSTARESVVFVAGVRSEILDDVEATERQMV